jgi:hypothetical protein
MLMDMMTMGNLWKHLGTVDNMFENIIRFTLISIECVISVGLLILLALLFRGFYILLVMIGG